MATQIQRRRGTTAQHSTFTGALGELTVDTDKKTVVVHDGITAGGFPLAVASTYATLESPALSGTPTAPTAAAGTNTTQLATTAYAMTAAANAVAGVATQPSITGSATLNGTTDNTIQLTGIVTDLGLEVGDVISIQYSGYNKLHTVESITNDNSIIVNYEHAGNRSNGSLKLPNTTANVTVTRIAKWHNAPLGLGQKNLNVSSKRAVGTTYTNTSGKSIYVFVSADGNAGTGFDVALTVDGVDIKARGGGVNGSNYKGASVSAIVHQGSSYIVTSGALNITTWAELR